MSSHSPWFSPSAFFLSHHTCVNPASFSLLLDPSIAHLVCLCEFFTPYSLFFFTLLLFRSPVHLPVRAIHRSFGVLPVLFWPLASFHVLCTGASGVFLFFRTATHLHSHPPPMARCLSFILHQLPSFPQPVRSVAGQISLVIVFLVFLLFGPIPKSIPVPPEL